MVVLLSAGCHSEHKTMVIRGEVSFAGRAVEKGKIEFVPIEGTKGPSTVANIVDGKYVTPGDKWGLQPDGAYEVRITAMRKTGRRVKLPPNMSKTSGPPPEYKENYIPAAYNAQSTLKLRVADVPDRNKVDFQLR
jgi:hypothetical protein